VTRTFWARNEHPSLLLADKTLTSSKRLYPVELISDYMCRNLRRIVDIYIYIYLYLIYQNCLLLKDSQTSPCICSKADFVSKATGTGVSLHVATSKRDSMWHSPVFTCIRANRIPVKRRKRTFFSSF